MVGYLGCIGHWGRDLGMSGDDAWEFMEGYGKVFGVDLSGFMFGLYFCDEGSDLLGMERLVWGKRPAKCKELTIGDLRKGIVAGRLDEEVMGYA